MNFSRTFITANKLPELDVWTPPTYTADSIDSNKMSPYIELGLIEVKVYCGNQLA
ncbi:hypothetical protein RS130_09755 [Paraglaciecola aquimarina]|uniref:Neurotransmitter-gated ion-channel ligand-binding domain-containing protein n=1 Tax=Paraglaciecola aquimarina TaxID=1235557 RepID=A0ABU3SVY2_9ALTE|nr:hypothetical protein [Paraglaciecola aquimarina]MDU0354178.1 hypothetical protein [Paraglaciecola aquimarina]